MHLQHLQHVRHSLLPQEFLRFRAREWDVALSEQGSDIAAGHLAGGVLLALQLAKALGSKAQLRLE